jgi:hypothetical protein
MKKSELKQALKQQKIKLGNGISYEQFLRIIGPRLGDRYSKQEIAKTF